MKKLLIIILLFFCIIGYAYGGENTTIYDDAPIIINEDSTETVTALEDGHLNTSFSNNHKGYCVEYTEQEAHKGDQFTPVHTSHIRNNRTIEDCVNPCSLFTLNTANGTGYSKDTASHMKIYEFKITDSSGNYKRYMIPVRNGSTGGMYDYITQQFYGESDGKSFTLGSDV